MNANDSPDHQSEPTPDDAPLPAPQPDPDAPRSRAGTPLGITMLGDPPVVLTDPPAIIGGASHTW